MLLIFFFFLFKRKELKKSQRLAMYLCKGKTNYPFPQSELWPTSTYDDSIVPPPFWVINDYWM